MMMHTANDGFPPETPTSADGSTETGADEPSPDTIGRVVLRIAAIPRARSLQMNLEVGALIFNSVFHGEPASVQARGRKRRSFRRLADHPDMPMSSTSLWRAVAAYQLSLELPELRDFKYVGIGHVGVVLGLPLALQRQLLGAAERERWSRRHLQARARELSASKGAKRVGFGTPQNAAGYDDAKLSAAS